MSLEYVRPMCPTPLSTTRTGLAWIAQFAPDDYAKAKALLDGMLLLNEVEVNGALLSLLDDVAAQSVSVRGRVALYAEREFAGSTMFRVDRVADANGRIRRRSTGSRGLPPVEPIRGSSRVGSEGMVAFVISQAKKSAPNVFLNHPGPDGFRKKRRVQTLAIVTDFVGSGTRVLKMLDKFWATPTIRAWASRGWIDFKVIAAAGTLAGVRNVRDHHRKPDVRIRHIVPTLYGNLQRPWKPLIYNYGPDEAGGAGRLGYKDNGALVAFTYGIPNNTPLILHAAGPAWRPLYMGAAPEDARSAFGLRPPDVRIAQAAEVIGLELRSGIPDIDAKLVIFLSSVRGRWREAAVTPMAEATGLTEQEILVAFDRAVLHGLIDSTGRLTDAGHLARDAARPQIRRPRVPTNTEPYYPSQLRAPRASSSTSRPSGRSR